MKRPDTVEFLKAQLQETADEQPLVVYCALCPEFRAEGTAVEARAAAEAHRVKEHATLPKKPKVARKKRAFSTAMSKEREAEIDEERRQRMRALGLS